MNDFRTCAERKLIDNVLDEARRKGVRHHCIRWFVKRKLKEIAVVRPIFTLEGSEGKGCSIPCALCRRRIEAFDLYVECTLSCGATWRGRMTSDDAPASYYTRRQMRAFGRM